MTRACTIAVLFLLAVFWGAGSASAEIFACVNNSSGTIKIVAQNTTCAQNQTLIVLNTTAGTGDAFSATASASVSLPNDGSFVTLLTLTLPVGNYAIFANLQLTVPGQTFIDNTVTCDIGNVIVIDEKSAHILVSNSLSVINYSLPLALQGVTDSGGSIQLGCSSSVNFPLGAPIVSAANASLIALRVGTLN